MLTSYTAHIRDRIPLQVVEGMLYARLYLHANTGYRTFSRQNPPASSRNLSLKLGDTTF